MPPATRLWCFVGLDTRIQAGLFEARGFLPRCPFDNLADEKAARGGGLRDTVDASLDRLQAEIHVALDQAGAAGDHGAIDVDARHPDQRHAARKRAFNHALKTFDVATPDAFR